MTELQNAIQTLAKISQLLGSCPAMSREAQKGFEDKSEANKAMNEYRVQVARIVIEAKNTASMAVESLLVSNHLTPCQTNYMTDAMRKAFEDGKQFAQAQNMEQD